MVLRHLDIAILEPRVSTDSSGDPRVHGVNAVFAVERVALATQRAILPRRGEIIGKWSISGGTNPENPGEPLLQVTENVNLGPGMVCVCPRNEFTEIPEWKQWKSEKPVTPLGRVTVSSRDYKDLGGRVEVLKPGV